MAVASFILVLIVSIILVAVTGSSAPTQSAPDPTRSFIASPTPKSDRLAEIEKLRAERDEVSNDTFDGKVFHLRYNNEIAKYVEPEDIRESNISCMEAQAVMRHQVRRMRENNPDVSDSELMANPRYARADTLKKCIFTPAPTPSPLQLFAYQLYDAYEADEGEADRKYKKKHALITGVVGDISSGVQLEEGLTPLFARVMLHSVIPCFVGSNTDSLLPLIQG